MIKPALTALALFVAASPALAHDDTLPSAEQQFAEIASWEGRWKVAETDALQIVFEITARGKTVVERWETANGLHSMTVYHLDGGHVIATHYCPQGNQPRLESMPGEEGRIAFAFRDITGLDEGESHAFTLDWAMRGDGTLVRTEVYRSTEGPGEPGRYTLSKAEDE